MKLAIISDIHEDVVRLKEAIILIEKLQCSEIVCLGDIVGFSESFYGYPDTKNATDCLSVIKANCSIIIAGNHDLYEIKRTPAFTAGFNYPDNWYELAAFERKKIADNKLWLYDIDLETNLNENDKEFLSLLPEYKVMNYNGSNILFSHFLYPDLSGSKIFPINPRMYFQHLPFIEKNNCDISFSGHTHIEGIMIASGNKLRFKSFRQYQLKKNLQSITVPAIANSTTKNGFITFDTNSFEIDVIPLKTPKYRKTLFYL